MASLTPQDGFPYYVDLVKDETCEALYASRANFQWLRGIDESISNYRYADDKWSIKQVVGHIIDHERIKMHRAFMLSRKMDIELWGYDQVVLIANSRFDELTFGDIISDFENVRRASNSFVRTLSKGQLALKGRARQHEVSLEDFLKSIIGHEHHHAAVLKEKYLGYSG